MKVNRAAPTGVRAEQVAATERRIIEAATQLFTDRGYVNTSLAEVAEAAGVAPRTVYVRFDNKAALFEACIQRAFGAAFRASARRHEARTRALEARTLTERIDACAEAASSVFDHVVPLLAAGGEAAATEPDIAAYERAGHRNALREFRAFADKLAADRLLPASVDVEVLTNALWALAGPRAVVSFARDLGWSGRRYRRWLEAILGNIAGA